jgi:hypothetical protein
MNKVGADRGSVDPLVKLELHGIKNCRVDQTCLGNQKKGLDVLAIQYELDEIPCPYMFKVLE